MGPSYSPARVKLALKRIRLRQDDWPKNNVPIGDEALRAHTLWGEHLSTDENTFHIYWNNQQANLFGA